MAFLSVGSIARYAMALVFTLGLAAVLPVGHCAEQTKATAPAETAAATQEPQDRPNPAAATGSESRPAKVSEDPQERNRRLMLLRLLVLGGGSYRPFGLSR